jgi:hypothetical protein
MGDWNTLHLFNEDIFYNQTVPLLKGKYGDLEKEYYDFLKYHLIGGIDRLSKSELNILCKKGAEDVIAVASNFDYVFTLHSEFMIDDQEERKSYLDKHNWFYDFNRFFEYIVFSTCADYFPWYRLGKCGLFTQVPMKNRSIGYEVISKLSMRSEYNLFCCDGSGIISWISSEEAALLKNDYSSVIEKNEFTTDFEKFLDGVVQNQLGLLAAVNLTENILKQLKSFKLKDEKVWMNIKLDHLFLQ